MNHGKKVPYLWTSPVVTILLAFWFANPVLAQDPKNTSKLISLCTKWAEVYPAPTSMKASNSPLGIEKCREEVKKASNSGGDELFHQLELLDRTIRGNPRTIHLSAHGHRVRWGQVRVSLAETMYELRFAGRSKGERLAQVRKLFSSGEPGSASLAAAFRQAQVFATDNFDWTLARSLLRDRNPAVRLHMLYAVPIDEELQQELVLETAEVILDPVPRVRRNAESRLTRNPTGSGQLVTAFSTIARRKDLDSRARESVSRALRIRGYDWQCAKRDCQPIPYKPSPPISADKMQRLGDDMVGAMIKGEAERNDLSQIQFQKMVSTVWPKFAPKDRASLISDLLKSHVVLVRFRGISLYFTMQDPPEELKIAIVRLLDDPSSTIREEAEIAISTQPNEWRNALRNVMVDGSLSGRALSIARESLALP